MQLQSLARTSDNQGETRSQQVRLSRPVARYSRLERKSSRSNELHSTQRSFTMIDSAQASNWMRDSSPSADAPAGAQRSHSGLHYCLILVLLPLLAIPAFIALGRSDFFLHHGASVWVQANDQIFDARDRECDVLVYGDSTAMTGIDPQKVEEQTGFRTCNISVTNAVLAVTGNLTLDTFLAHNRRPKVLLLQLSPDGFQPGSTIWQNTIYAEGLLELLRHGRPSEARHVLLTHPTESISFAGYAAGFTVWYGVKDAWFHLTHHRLEEDKVVVQNGFFTSPEPARTSCQASESHVAVVNPRQIAFSRSVVENFRRTYSDRAETVLVNVAPVPDCDVNLAAYKAELKGVTSNQLLPLPVGYFNNCCHYTAQGSEIVSSLVAQEVSAADGRSLRITELLSPTRQIASLRRVPLRVRR